MSQDWPLTRLEEITRKIGSGATPRGGKSAYGDSGISLIRSLNVYDLHFDRNELAYINEKQAEKLANVRVEPSDVLLNITGASVARCCMVPLSILPARVNQHVSIVRANCELVDPHFLMYCLVSPQYKHHLLTLAQGGATREALTKDTISNFEIPLPPLEIQRKIAAVLSAYDDLIENNRRRIAILEEMARRLYREWFVHFRFPGHEDVEMVEVEGYGRVPEDWEVVKLGEITTKIGSGATPSGGKNAYKEDGIALIRSLNVYDFNFDSNGLAFIDEEQASKLSNVIVDPKDILLNITGASVARCCMVPSYVLPARVNQHVSIVRVDPTLSNPYYILHSINSHRYKEMLLTLAQGGATREALTKGKISDFQIIHPPQQLLKQFGEIIESFSQQRDTLYKKNANLQHARDLLLPRLISGSLDVSRIQVIGTLEVTETLDNQSH